MVRMERTCMASSYPMGRQYRCDRLVCTDMEEEPRYAAVEGIVLWSCDKGRSGKGLKKAQLTPSTMVYDSISSVSLFRGFGMNSSKRMPFQGRFLAR
jgi:hypothetical protein